MTIGRPTKFHQKYCELAERYCVLGCTDKELAQFLDITEETLSQWKKKYPSFSESIKKGKEITDMQVADAMRIKALDGDTTAQIFWLKNRRRQHWRDKQEHEVTGKDGKPIAVIVRGDDAKL